MIRLNLDEYIVKKDIKLENITIYRIVNVIAFNGKINELESVKSGKATLYMNYNTASYIAETIWDEPYRMPRYFIPMYAGREIMIDNSLDDGEVGIEFFNK